MHRIDGDGHVDNTFVEGNPATGQEATRVTSDWLNAEQEEITAVIEGEGAELDKEDNGQLFAAIQSLHKGDILGLTHRQKDADEITLDGGYLGINGKLCSLAESLDKQFSGLTVDDWFRIYANQPAGGGRVITASELSALTEIPTYDHAKRGWYDATGLKRCLGYFLSNGASEIEPYELRGGVWAFRDPVSFHEASSGNPTSMTAIYPAAPDFDCRIRVNIQGSSQKAGAVERIYMSNGDSAVAADDTTLLGASAVSGNASAGMGWFMTNLDLELKFAVAAADATVKLLVKEIEIFKGLAGAG